MIIVTGGAGFIGRNLIARLNKIHKKNILVVDNLRNGKKYKNLIGLNILDYVDKTSFINKLLTGSYINKIKSIFHQGACTNTCEWNGKYMMDNNYQYSKDLFNYCVQHTIPFIYASSAAIYGKRMHTPYNNNNQPEKPVNIYSYSKYLFDQYVQKKLIHIKSQVCGLRYFNVYGPYESHKNNMASIIYKIYEKITDNKKPILFIGSKNFKRDFIHVDDIIDINLWIWKNNISGIYDCGTGTPNSFESVANIVLKFFNKKIVQYVPMPHSLKNCYQIFTTANTLQLKKIGYNHSFIKINDGINRYLNWLIHNQH